MGIKEGMVNEANRNAVNSACETANSAFSFSLLALLLSVAILGINLWMLSAVLELRSTVESFNESQADLKAHSMANRDIINAYVEGLNTEHKSIRHDLNKVLPTTTSYDDPTKPSDDSPHAVQAWARAKAKILERRIANDRKAHEQLEYHYRSATKQIEEATSPVKPLEN